jgi:uncharacterized protein (DUF58 family)
MSGEAQPDPRTAVLQQNSGRTIAARFLLLATLAYLLIFIGLVTVNGGPLALAIPLVVYIGAALIYRPPQVRLSARRQVSGDTVGQSTPIEVVVTITNEGPGLDEVMVEDPLPPGIVLVEGKTRALTSLPAGAEMEMRYTIRAGRGRYYLQDLRVSASDHLGVLRERASVPARFRLLFLPEIPQLRRVLIRPPRTHGHFGPIPSRKPGAGVDFYGLREYQLGDPRRWINWRASARHEEHLFVSQFEQERIADVGIILDARSQSNIMLRHGGSLFEYGVQAAGALSEALLNEGHKVGMLIYGFGMERVFPGYGRVQQERIVRALGQARTGHNFALESLGYLPTRFFPPGSQIVMVSPLTPGDVPSITPLDLLQKSVNAC